MDDNDVVCECLDIRLIDIKEAIENGASSFEQVQEATNVGNACGVCIDEVRYIVDELLES